MVEGLAPSDALSILKNGPKNFGGRKLGVYLTDGADAATFNALGRLVEAEGAVLEVVAPKIGGATLSDGTLVPAKQKIDGGPSVLYDAVALVFSDAGAELAKNDAPSRDFVADAFAHCKFIGYTTAAMPLLEKAGIAESLDKGCVELIGKNALSQFVGKLKDLRLWTRETAVDLDAASD